MGAGAMTEKETLHGLNSGAANAECREVLVDAHCHVWRTWPYEGPVPDPAYSRRGGTTDLRNGRERRRPCGSRLRIVAEK